MTGLRLAVLLVGGIALAPFSAQAGDPMMQLINAQAVKASSMDEESDNKTPPLVKPPPPKKPARQGHGTGPGKGPGQTANLTSGGTIAEKNKGNGGKKNNDTQEFLKVEMKEALITGRTAPPPKGPPSGGLLGGNNMGFNQNGPSATGTLSAPPPPPPPIIR